MTTKHSIERAKERIGANRKRAERIIGNALERGKGAEEFSSIEKEYLAKESSYGCTAIAYGSFCFIINESGKCVTEYRLPKYFGKKKLYNGKEKIRHPKAFIRNYDFADPHLTAV